MLTIGLTGGIGSGKSIVAEVFEVLEVPVYYADSKAKSLLNTDAELKASVKAAFGEAIYDEYGNVRRKELANLVFNNRQKLGVLNQLVHPAVREDFKKWKASLTGYPYIIQEAALLFETGAANQFDYMVTVSAPEETRIQRIINRDGISREAVLARMQNQLPQEQKDAQSDFVISNDGEHLVIPEVLKLHRQFKAESSTVASTTA